MADRKQINKISSLIKQGKGSEAYRAYEELSFGDQILVAVSPVVGDFLAGFEIKEFSSRASKNVKDKDYLGATGNFAIASLAAISLVPLFRWLRGSKGAAKAATEIATARRGKAGLKGPGEYQAEKAAKKEAAEKAAEESTIKAEKKLAAEKEAARKAELPVVEEFKPLSLGEMDFRGTVTGPPGNFQGLTSKAAKFINTNKKLPNQTGVVTYINALKKGGVSNGELKLLNLIDEFGDVHPKLLSEIQSSNPLDKITRQRLARYIKENQSSIDKGGIQKRMVSKRELEAEGRLISGNRILTNETEFTYHLPRTQYERTTELGRHYRGKPDHEAHYVFDAAADLRMPDYNTYADSLRIMPFDSKVIGPPKPILDKGDKVLNLGRIQSDYSKELGQAFTRNKNKQIELILRKQPIYSLEENLTIAINRIRDELDPDLIGSPNFLRENNFFTAIASAARKTSNLESSEQLQKAFIKDQQRLYKLVKDGKPLQTDEYIIEPSELSAFAKMEGASIKDSINKIVKTVKEFDGELDIFEPFIKTTKEVKEVFSVSPYKDTRKLTDANKAKNAYNKVVPTINKMSARELKLQKQITDSNLSPDSPSLVDLTAELESLGQNKLRLMPSSFDDIAEFTLNKSELKNATGKEFTDSLGKSLDEIFYETDSIPGGPLVQKYGPGTPIQRAEKYFNEIVNNPSPTFDIGNGVKILKRATKVKTDNIPGIKMDPYAVDNKTVAYKLPIRSRFLEAVNNKYDGFSLDSAAKRLGDEGGQDREFLEKLYDNDAPREIEKMLKELGVDPAEYMGKVDPEINQTFSGTYVKIDDALRKLVQEKGIDAFKAGGPVNIQDQLNQLNETILPIDTSSDVGSIKPNDFNSLLKETGISPVGSKGAESIILAMSIRAMNPLQKAQAIRASTAPVLKKLKSLHEQKQKYVENNSATQVNKYAERLNRYNRDIQLAENKIKDISKMYDPKNYKTGGAVDESKKEATERRLDAGEEIDDILKDLYGTAIASEFGEYDYNAPLNRFQNSIESSFSNYQDSIEKDLSNPFDFKYKDDVMDIYKSDDPEANIENRARKFSTNSINSLLDDLNLPVDVSRSNYGTSFDKRMNVAPNTNVTLDAYKSDDGDFTGDLNLRYSNRGKYGNIDLQSEINELGDTQDKIKYNQNIGPFSIQARKTAGRDATGSVSYNSPSIPVGNAQTIQARAVVDNLLNAKGQLDYMYNNPNTGYFVNAGLGLNSQRGPEFNLKFGKNF